MHLISIFYILTVKNLDIDNSLQNIVEKNSKNYI